MLQLASKCRRLPIRFPTKRLIDATLISRSLQGKGHSVIVNEALSVTHYKVTLSDYIHSDRL
jgi:hypothetical protein